MDYSQFIPKSKFCLASDIGDPDVSEAALEADQVNNIMESMKAISETVQVVAEAKAKEEKGRSVDMKVGTKSHKFNNARSEK